MHHWPASGLWCCARRWRRSKLARGPTTIRTENGQLAAYIFVDIRDRDLGGYVAEAATEKVGVEFPARRVGAASEVVVDVNFPRHG
jgi:hypothetical protein